MFVVEWQQVSSASFAQAKFEFNSLVFCSLANTTLSKFWQDLYRQHLLCFLSSQLALSPLLLFNFPSSPSFLSLSHLCFFSYISHSFCPTSFLLYFSFASLLSSTTFFLTSTSPSATRTHTHHQFASSISPIEFSQPPFPLNVPTYCTTERITVGSLLLLLLSVFVWTHTL